MKEKRKKKEKYCINGQSWSSQSSREVVDTSNLHWFITTQYRTSTVLIIQH